MNKSLLKAVALLLVLVMALGAMTACTPKEPTPSGNQGGNDKPETRELVVTAGAAGGAWYVFAAAFNEVWDTQVPGVKTTLIPGSGKSNPLLVSEGADAQIGFCYVGMSGDAFYGRGEFTTPAPDMRQIMSLNTIQYLSAIVDASLDIHSFDDIKAKKPKLNIAPGAAGSGSEQLFRDCLEAHGITYADIESWGGRIEYQGAGDGANSFKDGHINVLSNCAPQPYTQWVEVASARKVTVLPIEDYAVAKLESLGYQFGEIDTNAYGDPTGMIQDCGPTTNLICNKDLPDDLVYQLTKTLCESMGKLEDANSQLKVFDINHCIDTTIPIHPGAEKYFKEIGILK